MGSEELLLLHAEASQLESGEDLPPTRGTEGEAAAAPHGTPVWRWPRWVVFSALAMGCCAAIALNRVASKENLGGIRHALKTWGASQPQQLSECFKDNPEEGTKLLGNEIDTAGDAEFTFEGTQESCKFNCYTNRLCVAWNLFQPDGEEKTCQLLRRVDSNEENLGTKVVSAMKTCFDSQVACEGERSHDLPIPASDPNHPGPLIQAGIGSDDDCCHVCAQVDGCSAFHFDLFGTKCTLAVS